MSGVKLRSERVDQYDALGERGQPVYLAAPQILSTLKRRRADLAAHFAIPQPSADGSLIDWYAPNPGAVVPWAAASDAERADASARLAEVRQEVDSLRASLDEGEGSLFAQLLKWVLHHPDPSHVYLVDGKPVLTFWGFLGAGADRNVAPLHALSAASVPLAKPAVAAAPIAAAPAVVAATPWWRRWWLWLLLLLLLALLLFGLRACMPNAGWPGLPKTEPVLPDTPRVAPPKADLGLPDPRLPDARLPVVAGTVAVDPAVTALRDVPGGAVPAGSAVVPAAGAATGANVVPNANSPVPDAAANTASAAAQPPAPGQNASQNSNASQTPNALPPVLPDASALPGAAQAAAGAPLAIPPQLPDGKADFLNGDWRVRAGIQDRNTGEPLSLQYRFENGQGQVTLDRRNGVQCQAPVSAAMSGGDLLIDNGAAASCSDGTTYEMPAIRCQPGQANSAACRGQYGDEQFPLTMRQPQP